MTRLLTRPALPSGHSSWPLEDDDAHRSPAPGRRDRTHDPRRTDEPGRVPGLCRADAGAHPVPQRDHHYGHPPPTHKGSEVPRSVDAAGTALGCLPPYSPDLNPIKNAFPRLKAILRKAAGRAVNGLWDATRDALPRLIPQDCASYFTAAGYEPE